MIQKRNKKHVPYPIPLFRESMAKYSKAKMKQIPVLPMQFILSWRVPRELGGSLSALLCPAPIAGSLSDLPYAQKEVLAFSNPHTSKLYLIYDMFILPRLQAPSPSSD